MLCLCFEKLPLGWVLRGCELLGEHSLEIYLLNVSVFSQTGLWKQAFFFLSDSRLFYLMLFTLNILLGVGLHKGINWGSGRRRN